MSFGTRDRRLNGDVRRRKFKIVVRIDFGGVFQI